MSEVITTDSIKKYLKENVETLLSSGVQSNSTNVSIISKSHLKNAIIGFVLIFVLLVVLKGAIGPLTTWATGK